MKTFKEILPKAAVLFLILTFLCGVVYTGAVTGFAQVFFPEKANGSIIEVNGVKYGSSLLAQQYTDDAHMWGRIMELNVSAYKDENFWGDYNYIKPEESIESIIHKLNKKLRWESIEGNE